MDIFNCITLYYNKNIICIPCHFVIISLLILSCVSYCWMLTYLSRQKKTSSRVHSTRTILVRIVVVEHDRIVYVKRNSRNETLGSRSIHRAWWAMWWMNDAASRRPRRRRRAPPLQRRPGLARRLRSRGHTYTRSEDMYMQSIFNATPLLYFTMLHVTLRALAHESRDDALVVM